jgi:hypothetical protein
VGVETGKGGLKITTGIDALGLSGVLKPIQRSQIMNDVITLMKLTATMVKESLIHPAQITHIAVDLQGDISSLNLSPPPGSGGKSKRPGSWRQLLNQFQTNGAIS